MPTDCVRPRLWFIGTKQPDVDRIAILVTDLCLCRLATVMSSHGFHLRDFDTRSVLKQCAGMLRRKDFANLRMNETIGNVKLHACYLNYRMTKENWQS